MEKSRPLILITNDDSIDAPGLKRLIDVARPLGEVVAIAPSEPRSGQSSAITVNSPMRIVPAEEYNGVTIYTVNGTPVDCVKLGMHAVMSRKPDLILSGINHGSNSGNNIIYSGTMGAVLEGCMLGIPSVGFSLLHHSLKADFTYATPFVDEITRRVIDRGLPDGICLNVNIPSRCKPEGVKVVRAAHGHWTEEYARYEDPHGKPFYWLTGRFVNAEPGNPETDEYWLDRKFVTVVPARPDQSALDAISSVESLLD